MQKLRSSVNIARPVEDLDDDVTMEMLMEAQERLATVWVSRVTGIVGSLSLFIALSVWMARPGHFRLVLLFLVIAMFAAIMHSYAFESGQSS